MDQLKNVVLSQITAIEALYAELDRNKGHADFSGGGNGPEQCAEYNSMCLAAIERAVGRQHSYFQQAESQVKGCYGGVGSGAAIRQLYGIIRALKRDVEAGHLAELSEIVHASLFSDFLEMADHLLEQGYKDPAAVLAGGVLEEHLRQLCVKNGISLAEATRTGSVKPRRAESLNEALGKSVYNLLQQKTVTAWLDLRNKAAHAQYADYTKEQVQLLSAGLKNFIAQYPA
jgi:hypothetical protein